MNEHAPRTTARTDVPAVAEPAAGQDGEDRAPRRAPAGVVDVPWNLVVPTVDLHIVGYGLRLPNDFTLEMLAVLQRCKRVFGMPPLHAPAFKVPEMESLVDLYAPDKSRIETYREVVEVVLRAAIADPPVAFATYGSAMVGVLPAHRLIEEALRREVTVHVTSAVSSFDGIWADFNIEPFFGFEVWEATLFLTCDIEPDVRKHVLLPQAPALNVTAGPDVHSGTMEMSSTIPRLRDHLLRFYSPDHRVHFITTGTGIGPRALGADVETLSLRDLDQPGRSQGSTLLVPRAAMPGRGRFDFASRAAGVTPTAN